MGLPTWVTNQVTNRLLSGMILQVDLFRMIFDRGDGAKLIFVSWASSGSQHLDHKIAQNNPFPISSAVSLDPKTILADLVK